MILFSVSRKVRSPKQDATALFDYDAASEMTVDVRAQLRQILDETVISDRVLISHNRKTQLKDCTRSHEAGILKIVWCNAASKEPWNPIPQK
jgi:hypothetical protein